MEYRYLEAVIAVARYRSFSRAAEEIPCSQATVSRQVKAVEEELGYPIFERSTKSGSVRLTEKGEITLRKIEAIVANYNELFGGQRTNKSSSYRLGIFSGPLGFSAKSIIVANMYMRCPELQLQVYDVRRSAFSSELTQYKIDGLLMYEAFLTDETPVNNLSLKQGGLHYTYLRTQYPMIAFPRYHRLACRDSVSISELRDETFLLDYDIINQKIRNEDTAHRGLLLSCLKAGFTPKVVYLNVAGTNLVNIRDVAIMENGWIYPTFSLKSLHNDNNIVFVPLSEPLYYAQYYFVTLDSKRSENDKKVCECLRELANRA